MAQLPMRLSLKLALVLISIMGRMSGDAYNSDESNEDDQLKQALFLVNLLKSEYMRVLRENMELKKQTDYEEQDNSTCPTTVEDPGVSSGASTLQTTHSINLSDRQVELSSQSSLPSPVSLGSQSPPNAANRRVMIPTNADHDKQPYKYHGRRMMPEHSDNKYGKLRQLNYDDPFGEHPEETEISTTSPLQTANEDLGSDKKTTASPAAAIDQDGPTSSTLQAANEDLGSEEKTAASQSAEIDQGATAPSSTLRTSKGSFRPLTLERKPMRKLNGTGTKSKRRIKKKKKRSTKPPTTESDSVMSQVAAELINELNGEKNEKGKPGLGKINLLLENTETPQLLRSTMKVYLEGSSRYPVPLPENHAFCHTNPYNPLCRTFIG